MMIEPQTIELRAGDARDHVIRAWGPGYRNDDLVDLALGDGFRWIGLTPEQALEKIAAKLNAR